jgi:ethanolamine utilization protein EutN
MRIGKVVGTVTLCRWHESIRGARYRIVVPLSLDNLRSVSPAEAEEFVMYDELGAGEGSLVAISEGAEAAQPFRPEIKPVDAYCAAVLDSINL